MISHTLCFPLLEIDEIKIVRLQRRLLEELKTINFEKFGLNQPEKGAIKERVIDNMFQSILQTLSPEWVFTWFLNVASAHEIKLLCSFFVFFSSI